MDALKEIAGLANHLRHGNVTLWAIADDEYCAEMGLTVEEQGETLSEFLHGVDERIDSEVRFTEGTSGKDIERADRHAEWLDDIEAELFGERIETFTHGDHERQSERINDILVAAKDKASQMPKGVDWPRFEDGEPVRFLDDFERYGYENGVSVVTMYTDGSFAINFRTYSKGERVKRPAPKVYDVDGVEIHEGDKVYFTDGREQECDTAVRVNIDYKGEPYVQLGRMNDAGYTTYTECSCIDPSQLTHERPDSFSLIEQDSELTPYDYALKYGKPDGVSNGKFQRVDLVRRARALAEKED